MKLLIVNDLEVVWFITSIWNFSIVFILLSAALLRYININSKSYLLSIQACYFSNFVSFQRIDWPPEPRDYELCTIKGKSKVDLFSGAKLLSTTLTYISNYNIYSGWVSKFYPCYCKTGPEQDAYLWNTCISAKMQTLQIRGNSICNLIPGYHWI